MSTKLQTKQNIVYLDTAVKSGELYAAYLLWDFQLDVARAKSRTLAVLVKR